MDYFLAGAAAATIVILCLLFYNFGYSRGLLRGLTAYATLDIMGRAQERISHDIWHGTGEKDDSGFDGLDGFLRKQEEE